MTRMSAIVLAAVMLVVTMPAPALAQAIPYYGRAYSPEEGRQMTATIGRLSVQYKVAVATLNTIAVAAGRRGGTRSFAEIVALVSGKAQEAADLKKQVAALSVQVAALSDPRLRDPAARNLTAANDAIEQGRLEDADAILRKLDSLRQGTLNEDLQAWLTVIDTRAKIAELKLDYEAAAQIRLSAASLEARKSAKLQWGLIVLAAHNYASKGYLNNSAADLATGLSLLNDRAMPLLDSNTNANEVGLTAVQIGQLYQIYAFMSGDARYYTKSIESIARNIGKIDRAVSRTALIDGYLTWAQSIFYRMNILSNANQNIDAPLIEMGAAIANAERLFEKADDGALISRLLRSKLIMLRMGMATGASYQGCGPPNPSRQADQGRRG